jgi:TIR domain
MADVFVSYAKADRSLALKLVAMLEAEGWNVWWDTTLAIGDDFRNEIMTELGRARAVVVIWTDASIKSDWVRSEAGRAQDDRKLIPVKLSHLEYRDLPPPFDVLHTENLNEDDKICSAITSQLAKPSVESTAAVLLAKGAKSELLTWIGIVGGALTLFTNLSGVLKLADWAQFLIQNWRTWTREFWLQAFGWLGIHLAPAWTPALSFLLFCSLLIAGQAIKFASSARPYADKSCGKSFELISARTLFCLVFVVVSVMGGIILTDSYDFNALIGTDQRTIAFIVRFMIVLILPTIVISVFARQKIYAAATFILMSLFWTIIGEEGYVSVVKKEDSDDFQILVLLMMLGLLPVVLLSVAPAKAVSRRLVFLAIGLILLVVLNELSKLGLDMTAPKLHG